MCGIAGLIGTRNDVTRERLQTLAASLAHRGPDDEGIDLVAIDPHADRSVGFVHRRLSIIDLSPAGHQPMRDPETGNWITFNGEIYNFRELRRSLAASGATFRTASDTEVILKAYARYGRSCVDHLDGMFAFALWDASAERLMLAVDRVGIKPLYWRNQSGRFSFASEVRALLRAGLAERQIDHEAVASFLAFGSVQAPRTILVGVYQLLPGHTLTYEPQTRTVSTARYWSPSQSGTTPSSPSDVARVLAAAVTRHLVSDVPVGLFLSGGIDSSALAVLAHHVGAGDAIESFTVTFPEASYAEGAYARHVGERYCHRHHELMVSETDLGSALPAALDAMDQPSIDGTNVYLISRAVRAAGITAILSGQGGDEVFGGYSTFRRLPKMMAAHRAVAALPWAMRRGLARSARAWSTTAPVAAKLAAFLTSSGGAIGCYAVARQLFHPDVRQQLCGHEQSDTDSGGAPTEAVTSLQRELSGLDASRAVSLLELRGYLANTLLRDSDVMSMAHGLEVRVPYLDRELIETVFRVPARLFADARLPKPLLLRAVQAELPPEVYRRKKMGFTFPWEVWLRGRLRPQIEELLHTYPAEHALGLNADACRRLWTSFWSRRDGVTWARPWALHVLMSWAQRQGFV